ncbi:MAG: hypothetical protein R6W76_08150, partial [Caldilinea sp.]
GVSLAPPADALIVAPPAVLPSPVTGASRRRDRQSLGSSVLTVVGGLIVMASGILLGMQAPRMLRPAQPPAGVVAPVTATPSPPAEESAAFIDASPTAVAIIASTAEPSPESSPTAATDAAKPPVGAATETPAGAASPTPQPPSSPIATATTAPTAIATPTATAPPTATLTPTATPPPTETATVTPTETPDPEATLTACLSQAEETLQRYLTGLAPDQRASIGCPLAAAQVGPAQMTPLERGYMVGLNEVAELYIVYLSAGAWEQQPITDDGVPADLPQPPDGRYLPTGRFVSLWAADGRWERLGFAVEPEPVDFTVVIQPFEGGVLIGNRDTTDVAVLPVAGE